MATDPKPAGKPDFSKLTAKEAARECIRLARLATRRPDMLPPRHNAAQAAAAGAADAICSSIAEAFNIRDA